MGTLAYYPLTILSKKSETKKEDPRIDLPRSFKSQVSECLALTLPEDGDRVPRIAIAAPARAQPGLARVEIAAHTRHALPRLAVALGDVELIAGTEPGAPLLVVDGLDPLGEEPADHDPLIRDGRRTAHGRDIRTGAVGLQVDDDPLDRRLVRGVAGEQTEPLDILLVEGLLARQQILPPPVLLVHALEARGVGFERALDTEVSLPETDPEREVGVAADRPGRSRGEQTDEDVLRDPPLLLGVRASQLGDELCGGPLERILLRVSGRSRDLGREELAGQGVDRPIHPSLLANRLAQLDREAGVRDERANGLETTSQCVIQKACHGTYLLPVNRGRIESEELPLYSTYHFVQRGVLAKNRLRQNAAFNQKEQGSKISRKP